MVVHRGSEEAVGLLEVVSDEIELFVGVAGIDLFQVGDVLAVAGDQWLDLGHVEFETCAAPVVGVRSSVEVAGAFQAVDDAADGAGGDPGGALSCLALRMSGRSTSKCSAWVSVTTSPNSRAIRSLPSTAFTSAT